MKKTNVWEIVKAESDSIIKAIEKGEIKSVSEINEYATGIYNYRVADAIISVVNAYVIYYNIGLPYSIDEQ